MSITLRQRMHQDLQLAGLAEGTQKMYLRAVRQLAAHFREAARPDYRAEVRDYLLYLKNERKYYPSSLKIAASGIVFFLHPHRPTRLAACSNTSTFPATEPCRTC